MKQREGSIRAFAVVGAAMTLAALPMALVSTGRVLEHPLSLSRGATPGGTARAELATPDGPVPVVVTEVRYGEGPWRPATRLDTLRERSGLPIGTPVAYRLRRADGSVDTLEGRVRERPAASVDVVTRLAWIFVAGGLAAGALVLAVGATGLRSLVASAAIAGTGYVVGLGFLESTLVVVGSAPARDAIVLLSRTFPYDVTYFLLFWMLEIFPGALPRASWRQWIGRTLFVLGVTSAAVRLVGEIPGLLELRLSQTGQARWLAVAGLLRTTVTLICGISAVFLVAAQRQLYRRAGLGPAERRRTRLAGWALLAGVAPSVVLAAVQVLGRLLTGRLVIPTVAMSLAFAPLVSVPAVVVFLSLSPEAAPAKLLVRRAAVFLLARRTVRILCFAPLVLLGFHLWGRRNEPLSAILAAHPISIGVAAAMAVLGLAWREAFQRRVERWMESSPPDADRIVSAVGDRARGAASLEDLAVALSAEVMKGFGVTDAAFFVIEESSGLWRAAGRDMPGLEPDAPAVAAMRSHRGPVDVDDGLDAGRQVTAEQQSRWARATGLRLLVPLVGSGSGLIAFLGVGPKRNEMPFEEADRVGLRAVATAASLAVENLRLRSSSGSGARAETPGTRDVARAVAREDFALWCPTCSKVFSSASGGLCSEDGTPLRAGDVPLPHVLAGRYLLEHRLGAGGMGSVWRARDLTLGRPVAVKTLSRLSPEAAARFRREARAAARFLHPNLAAILTSEAWRGVPVLVFECLEGGTLAQRLQAGRCWPHEVARWGALLSGALHVAHDGGVLHRDVKPSNIGFTRDGTPKLLDFGLAAVFDDDEEPGARARGAAATDASHLSLENTVARLTRSGVIVGTIPHLSPEAVVGRPAMASFDLWGLTLSLYEAVTGQNPFFGETAHETLRRILSERVPDPRELRRDCPPALAAVLNRNLSSNVDERARTAAVLRAEFLAIADSVAL